MDLSTFQILMQDSWYTVVFAFGGIVLLYYFMRSRKDYTYFINMFEKDFVKASKVLEKTDDLALKKDLILHGRKDLGERLYYEVKDFLINNNLAYQCFKQLNTGTAEEKISSCQVLAMLNTPKATDYCITALYDEDISVRKEAIDLLANKADLKIINTLINYLQYCDSQSLLKDLTTAFEQIGNKAFKQLKNVILTHKPEIKIWAIRILNSMELQPAQSKELFQLYLNLVDNSATEIKLEVIHGLEELAERDEKAVFAKLSEKLSASEWKVRAEAAKAIGNSSFVKGCDKLYQLVDDPHHMVRKNTFYSLVKLGYEGIKFLIKAAHNSKYSKEAIEVLDDLDTKFLVEAIIKIYDTDNEKEKRLAKDLLQTKLEKKTNDLKVIG